MWTPQERAVFYNSLERCIESRKFLDRFYELFLDSSPEVREKFKNTDFAKQKQGLKVSFYLIFAASEGKQEGLAHLDRIARLHSKAQLNIGPHLYGLWRDCLVQAVKECDPGFNSDVEAAWVKMVSTGIDYLIAQYYSTK